LKIYISQLLSDFGFI